MNKKQAGSHQTQDTEAKTCAFGLGTDPIYFFPINGHWLQEV